MFGCSALCARNTRNGFGPDWRMNRVTCSVSRSVTYPVLAHAGAVDVELRVERLALAAHGDPARESRPRAVVIAHVPLAEEAGPVSGCRQRLRKCLEPVARGIARGVVDDAVRVTVLAGQDRRPARRAERGGGERVAKGDAFAGHAIDRRRLDEGMTRKAEIVPAQVVDEDDDDIGRLDGLVAGIRHAGADAHDHDQRRQEPNGSHVSCFLTGPAIR